MSMSLLHLLESILGKAKLFRGVEAYFKCPFCNHHKKKLAVSLDNHNFHCWVCDVKGKSLPLLFNKIGASKTQMGELYDIIGYSKSYKSRSIEKAKKVELPKEFRPMWRSNTTPEYRRAINYLKSRGVVKEDILKYNIGYCDGGLYDSRIIIPSYDGDGKLNYFVGRSFIQSNMKYKNPPVSKNVIGFELFVNWNFPIFIVEGSLDAIAIKRNVIPIFGKTIPKTLQHKIIEKGVKDIYIALDSDARKDALEMAENFMKYDKNVYFIDIPGGEDPSTLGFKKFHKLVGKTDKLSFGKLLKMRLM